MSIIIPGFLYDYKEVRILKKDINFYIVQTLVNRQEFSYFSFKTVEYWYDYGQYPSLKQARRVKKYLLAANTPGKVIE